MPGATEAEVWLDGLFADLCTRAPHGIGWSIDRAEPPLRIRVGLADGPASEFELSDNRPLARIAVAERVQTHIDAAWNVTLPPCPDHGTGLRPVRTGDAVHWRCPLGDVECPIGAYDELLWPPRPTDIDRAGSLLGSRLRRRNVTGVSRWNIDGGVVQATVHEGGDAEGLRAAARPLRVRVEWTPPIGWRRTDGTDGACLSVRNGWSFLARIEGQLNRSPLGGLCVGDLELRLSFEHRVGGPGEPLLLDADGVPFANAGDVVVCGGGIVRGSPVRDAPGVVVAGSITRTGPGPSPSGTGAPTG